MGLVQEIKTQVNSRKQNSVLTTFRVNNEWKKMAL